MTSKAYQWAEIKMQGFYIDFIIKFDFSHKTNQPKP